MGQILSNLVNPALNYGPVQCKLYTVSHSVGITFQPTPNYLSSYGRGHTYHIIFI